MAALLQKKREDGSTRLVKESAMGKGVGCRKYSQPSRKRNIALRPNIMGDEISLGMQVD